MEDLTKTRVFSSEDMRREMIRSNLKTVINALNEDTMLYIKSRVISYLMILHTSLLIKMQEILFNKLKEMKLLKN